MAPLKLTAHEHIDIVEETPEVLVVEVTYAEPGSPPPRHLHPAQDEHFEVLSGRLTAKVGGKERVLETGDTLDVARGTVHQMWNAGPDPVRARWETRPAGRTAEWFRAIDGLLRSGRVGRNGMPPLTVMAALLREYDDVFRLVGVPTPVLGALAPLGRRAAGEALP